MISIDEVNEWLAEHGLTESISSKWNNKLGEIYEVYEVYWGVQMKIFANRRLKECLKFICENHNIKFGSISPA